MICLVRESLRIQAVVLRTKFPEAVVLNLRGLPGLPCLIVLLILMSCLKSPAWLLRPSWGSPVPGPICLEPFGKAVPYLLLNEALPWQHTLVTLVNYASVQHLPHCVSIIFLLV